MLRRHPKIRLYGGTLAVVLLFGWMVPNIFVPLGVTAYDMATSGICKDAIEGGVKDFADRSDHMDYERQDALIAADMATSLRTLRAEVDGAHCPTYTGLAKSDLLEAIDQNIATLDAIAHGGPVDFEKITKAFAYTREKLDALRKALGET